MNKKILTPEKELILRKRNEEFQLRYFGHYTILPKDILLNDKDKHIHLDAYVGVIQYFDWLAIESETGAGFSPILYKLESCKKRYKNKKIFDFLKRKITYLRLLHDELRYLLERYNWKKLPSAVNVFLSKFEDFISTSCEILLIIVDITLKSTRKYKNNIDKYADMVDVLDKYNISEIFKTINHYLYISLLVCLRNSIVHKPNLIRYNGLKSQKPSITFTNIKYKNKRKDNDRLHKVISHYYNGLRSQIKKIPNQGIKISDIRSEFKGFTYVFFLNKKCNVDIKKWKISYSNKMIHLVDKVQNMLFAETRVLLEKL